MGGGGNYLLKDISGTFSIQYDAIQDKTRCEQDILEVRYFISNLEIKEIYYYKYIIRNILLEIYV